MHFGACEVAHHVLSERKWSEMRLICFNLIPTALSIKSLYCHYCRYIVGKVPNQRLLLPDFRRRESKIEGFGRKSRSSPGDRRLLQELNPEILPFEPLSSF